MILSRTLLLATGATLAVTGPASAWAQTRTIQVTVTDTAGTAVANADICVDGVRSGARLGEGRTDAAGRASVFVAEENTPSTIGGPAVTQLKVTASAGQRGALVQSGPVPMVTLRLPASGGPLCATGQVTATRPGGIAIDGAAIRAKIDALPQRQPFESVRISMVRERCFGAAGMQCGDQFGQTGTCLPGVQTCTINVGSWKHDECCFRNPTGGMCGLDPAAPFAPGGISSGSTVCQAEFNLAVARLLTPFSWRRQVEFSRVNTTGTVEHALYCAPAGTLMAEGEERFCCTGRVRVLASAERSGLPERILQLVPARDIRACAA